MHPRSRPLQRLVGQPITRRALPDEHVGLVEQISGIGVVLPGEYAAGRRVLAATCVSERDQAIESAREFPFVEPVGKRDVVPEDQFEIDVPVASPSVPT
jgi:hypothetical protein